MTRLGIGSVMSDGMSSEINNRHCDSGSDRELRGFLRVELVFFFNLIGRVGGVVVYALATVQRPGW